MSITREDVESLAVLARLSIDDRQIESTTTSIDSIISMVGALEDAETEQVSPLSHPLDVGQRLRPDQPTESDKRAALQALAPDTEDGLYLVPKVID